MNRLWASNRRGILASLALIALVVVFWVWLGPQRAANTLLSGLTLGALYFLLAAGLSLIFGMMDVLNFAHGVLFMMGAYAGYTAANNPRVILNTLPILLVLLAGFYAGQAIPLRVSGLRGAVRWAASFAAGLAAIYLIYLGVRNFPIRALVSFEATTAGGAVPTERAQEALSWMINRLANLALAGGLLGLIWPKAEVKYGGQMQPLAKAGLALLALVLAIGIAAVRSPAEAALLGLSFNLRFTIAMLAGGVSGLGLGYLIETAFIRPFYGKPVTQIVLTLGLSLVGTQVVKSVWGEEGKPPMPPPDLFTASCKANTLAAWFSEHCSSIDVLGRAFPTYRLFIIALGAAMFILIWAMLRYTRIGMIVRAGVQDPEMVEALGINVRQVFTFVFTLGSGMAALGGVAAAPFIGLYPDMGSVFQLQAFIAVVLGGMGSYVGAALGTIVLGIARSFGDYLVALGIAVPWLEAPLRGSPALARASTVLIMALVLLLRPEGIFGKKEP